MGFSIVLSLAQHLTRMQHTRIYHDWLPSVIYSPLFSPFLQHYHNSERLLRATKHSKCSRAAWQFDGIPKQKFIQIYHIVLNIRDSEMEGVPTELLSWATLTTLFAITHNLCQQNTDSNKEWFCTHLKPLNTMAKEKNYGPYKHLSASYQLFIITEVKL